MDSTNESKGPERRRHRRHAMLAVGTVNHGRMLIPCIVTNLSRGGARIRLVDDESPLPREPVKLEVRGLGLLTVNVVWQRGAFAGLKFADEIELPVSAKAAA